MLTKVCRKLSCFVRRSKCSVSRQFHIGAYCQQIEARRLNKMTCTGRRHNSHVFELVADTRSISELDHLKDDKRRIYSAVGLGLWLHREPTHQ